MKLNLILLCSVLLSCSTGKDAPRLEMTGDTAKLKADLYRIIPKGSALADAETIMKRNGFKCSFLTNRDFMETAQGGGNGTLHPGRDFLYCDLEKGHLLSFTSERWQVCITHKNDRVTGIYVSYGLTGL